MEKIITQKDKLEFLSGHYKKDGLLLVGMNGLQTVNSLVMKDKKNVLNYLDEQFKNESLKPEVIDAFSMVLNKTEHVDMFLKSNLSVEEIKLSQLYSKIEFYKELMSEMRVPSFFKKIFNYYELEKNINSNDKYIFLTSSLRDAFEPCLIYSSGYNNLMSRLGGSPSFIASSYEKQNTKFDYDHAVSKTNNPRIIKEVMNHIKNNFETILAVNDKTEILGLNASISKYFEKPGLEMFGEYVYEYNYKLKEVCNEYNVTYVDTSLALNNGEIEQKELSNLIIESLYEKKNKLLEKSAIKKANFKTSDDGPVEMYHNLKKEAMLALSASLTVKGLVRKDEINYARDKIGEVSVIKKVLEKSNTIHVNEHQL